MLEEFFPRRRNRISPGSHRLTQLMQDPDGQAALRAPTVLIVGTNGKGTTARYLEAELLESGLAVGTYMSPHYINPLERIRLNGSPVEPPRAKLARDRVLKDVAERLPDASFFEITTAIALLIFHFAQVDVVIAEAGLGGRFDSTNALSPLLTVLTSVGLDHMDRLGNTLFEIAFDKAQASRRGRRLICGPLDSEARKGVEAAVQRTGAIPNFNTLDQTCTGLTALDANRDTAARALIELKRLAVQAPPPRWTKTGAAERLEAKFPDQADQIKATLSSIAKRLECIRLPGRFDVRNVGGKTFILDNAHNSAASKALAELYQKAYAQPARLLFGSLTDKPYGENLSVLKPISTHVTLCPFNHESSVSTVEFQALVAELKRQGFEPTAAVLPLRQALEDICSSDADEPVLVTGSFAFVGAVMEELRLNPEPDLLVARTGSPLHAEDPRES